MKMYPRHRLDVSERQLLRALRMALQTRERNADVYGAQLAARFDTDVIAVLSVRSAFELLLEAQDLESGDEVVMSAVTIGDMGHIVSSRGLHE